MTLLTQLILPTYSKISTTLASDKISISPAEMQGLLFGMLCAGFCEENGSWMQILQEVTNDDKPWPLSSIQLATDCFNMALNQLTDSKISLELLLPENQSSFLQRAEALTQWVSAFMTGFGLVHINSGKLSKDAMEIFNDLTSIAQLGIDEDASDAEQEELLEVVIEHVKMCALTLYVECAIKSKSNIQEKPTLH